MLESASAVITFLFMPWAIFIGGIGTLSALVASDRRRSYFLAAIFGGVLGLFADKMSGLTGAAAATWFVFAFGPGIARKVCAGLGALFGIILQTGPGWADNTTTPTAHLQDFVISCQIDAALAAAGAAVSQFVEYVRSNYANAGD